MKKVLLLILVFAVTGLAEAQDQSQGQGQGQYQGPSQGPSAGAGDSQPNADAPAGGPGVAHISLIHGDVSMQRGDSGDWVATSLNTPIVSGDVVATSDGSRAEVQLDNGDVLRLSGQSQAKIADLSRNHIQVQISQGYANLSMFQGSDAEVEIDTPNASIRPHGNGRFRIEVNSNSESNVIVRDGEAEISTPQGSTTVKAGDLITIRGTDDPEYKVGEAPGADDWDHWNAQRDDLIRNSEGVRHTNRYYSGAQDLDAYGHWTHLPQYGDVWAPASEPADWAPYQAGRWVWEPYYGWTWVSYEPWGWAPYHYGRWFFYGASWYWWPGPVTPFFRPIWAPAFVSFFGFGPHVGFGFGFASIGWCPLAPFEVFHPWWGVGFNRFGFFGFHDRFGFGVHGNFGLAFSSARVRAGITTVSAENFGRGPAGFRHGVDVGALREAHMANGNLGFVPNHESLSPTNRGFRSAPAGIRNINTTHFAGRTSSSGSTGNFHSETSRMQEAIRAHGGNVNASEGGRFSNSGGFNRGGTQNGGNRPGFSTFSRNSGNEGRTDRPPTASRTFGGNERGTTQNNPSGNRDGFHTFSSEGSRGGTFDRGGQGRSDIRNDRPPSSSGGGSRPQVDFGKRLVVPRNDTSSRSTGNNGGRNSGGNSNVGRGNVYSGGRGYSGGGYNGRSSGGGSSRGNSSYGGGRSSGGGGHSGGGSRSGGGSSHGGRH